MSLAKVTCRAFLSGAPCPAGRGAGNAINARTTPVGKATNPADLQRGFHVIVFLRLCATISRSCRTEKAYAPFRTRRLTPTGIMTARVARVTGKSTVRLSRPTRGNGAGRRRDRLDPDQRRLIFVGQQIQQPVWTLPHVPNPLMEVSQQRLAPELLPLVVEHDPLELSGRRHFAFAHPTDKRVALPAWKAVAGVEHEARRRNRRHPEDDRLLESGRRGRKARAVVVAAVADDRPAVVAARLQHVQFVATVWTVFMLPDLAGVRVDGEPKLHPMTDRENRRLVASLSDKRIIRRHAPIVPQAQDFAGEIVGVLG